MIEPIPFVLSRLAAARRAVSKDGRRMPFDTRPRCAHPLLRVSGFLWAFALAALPLVAQAEEPILLKFGSAVPPTSWPNTLGGVPWTKAVEEASGGLIQFQVYLGGTVVTQRNTYDRLLNSVVDAAYGAFSEAPGTFQKVTVSTLPFEAPRAVDASVALWRLFETGLIADEMAAAKPIAMFGYNPSGIQTSRQITKAEDMRGIKLATIARSASEEVSQIGGTPITMPPSEIYQSIQRGLVAGAVLGWTGVQTFKLDEVTRFHLEVPFGNNPAYFMMNKESYAKLPDKAKAAVDKNTGINWSTTMGKNSDKVEEEGRARVRAIAGHTITTLDPQEVARWRERLASIADEWVKATPDGAKVLAAYRAEVAKAAASK